MAQDVIYQFQFSDGSTYIGKLDNEKRILWTHMKWLPWMPRDKNKVNQQQSSWETAWKLDVLINGFANQSYVNTYGFVSVEEVVNNIRASMTTLDLNDTPTNLFDILKQVWLVDDREACEAICILLATKRHSLQNKQIDFFSRPLSGGVVTKKDISRVVSNEEFQRRYSVAVVGLADALYLNFKRRNQSVIQELVNQLNIEIERRTTRKGALSFRSREMKELAKLISYKITDKTVSDIMKQLRRKASKSGGENYLLEPMLNQIESALRGKAYTKSGNLRKTTTYGELFKIIYDILGTTAQQRYEVFEQDTDKNIVETFYTWIQDTNLSAVFKPKLHHITEEDKNYYKQRMTNWIQDNIFSHFDLNSEYTRAQWEKYVNSPQGEKGEAWLPSREGTIYENNPALITQTKVYIPTGNSFMINRWFNAPTGENSMYGEQVSIWLGTGDPFGQWHTINAFSNQPTSRNDLDHITVY